MRIQIYYRFGDWLTPDGEISSVYNIYYSPIAKPVYLIHDSWDPDKNKKLIDGRLHMEDSAAGSTEFSVSRRHPFYSKFCNILLDTVYVVIDGLLVWDGRPTKMDIDWNGTKKIYFEGALSYLSDSLLGDSTYVNRSTLYTFISDQLLPKFNSGCEYMSNTENRAYLINDRAFYENASVIFDGLGDEYYWNTNYESCLEWLKTYILGNFQARAKIVYPIDAVDSYLLQNKPIPRYLCVINDFTLPAISDQLPTKSIDFAVNMLSYSYSIEANDKFATNFLPRGETRDDTSGREMKKFVLLSSSGSPYLDAAAANRPEWHTYYTDMKKDQRHYGNICKPVDFNSVKTPLTLWKCAREKYKIIRKKPFIESITVSGADIIPAKPAIKPIQDTPTLTTTDNTIVACSDLNNEKTLISDDPKTSAWPKTFKYYHCNPTYFDLWTRVVANSKPHFMQSKTWYITGIDMSFDNPLTPEITMENNQKGITDEYIQNGARIGDVAGAFQPSS